MNDLYNFLKPREKDCSINIDVAFINVLNGEIIGNVFKKLGVS